MRLFQGKNWIMDVNHSLSLSLFAVCLLNGEPVVDEENELEPGKKRKMDAGC